MSTAAARQTGMETHSLPAATPAALLPLGDEALLLFAEGLAINVCDAASAGASVATVRRMAAGRASVEPDRVGAVGRAIFREIVAEDLLTASDRSSPPFTPRYTSTQRKRRA